MLLKLQLYAIIVLIGMLSVQALTSLPVQIHGTSVGLKKLADEIGKILIDKPDNRTLKDIRRVYGKTANEINGFTWYRV